MWGNGNLVRIPFWSAQLAGLGDAAGAEKLVDRSTRVSDQSVLPTACVECPIPTESSTSSESASGGGSGGSSKKALLDIPFWAAGLGTAGDVDDSTKLNATGETGALLDIPFWEARHGTQGVLPKGVASPIVLPTTLASASASMSGAVAKSGVVAAFQRDAKATKSPGKSSPTHRISDPSLTVGTSAMNVAVSPTIGGVGASLLFSQPERVERSLVEIPFWTAQFGAAGAVKASADF
jgi:hypothetical protein